MNLNWMRIIFALAGTLGVSSAQAAVDSYRFMHVTISTPWYIFLFLLTGVFAPFILMAALAWYSAARRSDRDAAVPGHKPSVE